MPTFIFRNWRAVWILPVLAIFFCVKSFADPISHWQQRSPLPTGYDIYDMTFGNGMFVGVGWGPIVTSTNGMNWDVQNTGEHLYDVTFGNGIFVGAYLSKNVAVSSDGIHWASFPVTLPMEGIGFCNGAFLGGGYDGSTFGILSSSDGTNWSRCATISGNVTQIIYGGGRYLATGYSGKIFVSTNLTDWSISNTGGDVTHNGICYGNGLYVAVGGYGGAYISSDAINWTNTGTQMPGMNRIKFINGTFVAVGPSSQSIVSTDGTNWINVGLPAPLNISITYGGIAYGNGVMVAAGTRGQVSTSTNFTNWVSRFHGTVEDLYGVTYGSNQWVSVGNLAETITSTNGVDWLTRRSQYSGILTAVCYANGLFVAANDDSTIGSVFISSNLNSWIECFPQPGPALYAIAFGNNTWVAVGALGALWTSSDGTNWQVRTTGNNTDLTGITYAKNKFVAVGDGGLAMSSADGISWPTNNSTTTAHLNGIVFAQGFFLAVGVNGTMIISADGIHWQPHSLNTLETFTGVAYGEGYFVAVGLGGDIITSPDSWNWTIQNSPSDQNLPSDEPLLSVAYGDHSFLAVGLGGMVVQSDPFIYLNITKSNAPILSITGPASRTVSIQAISSLNGTSQWSNIATVSITNQPTLWMDTQATSNLSRFYRAVMPQ